MAKVSKDFLDLFECFARHEVRALVIGAHAVAHYAKPRYTKDIDLFIEASKDNAARILRALDDFGFGSLHLAENDFTEPGTIIQLGVEPNRIDLINEIPGVLFAEAWEHRVAGDYGGRDVFYIGLVELRRAKQAAGRPQDLADLDWLREIESASE